MKPENCKVGVRVRVKGTVTEGVIASTANSILHSDIICVNVMQDDGVELEYYNTDLKKVRVK